MTGINLYEAEFVIFFKKIENIQESTKMIGMNLHIPLIVIFCMAAPKKRASKGAYIWGIIYCDKTLFVYIGEHELFERFYLILGKVYLVFLINKLLTIWGNALAFSG